MSIADEKVLRLRNEKRLVEEDGDLETKVKGRLIGVGVWPIRLQYSDCSQWALRIGFTWSLLLHWNENYRWWWLAIGGDGEGWLSGNKEDFIHILRFPFYKTFCLLWSRPCICKSISVLEIQTVIWTSDITTNRYLVVVVYCSSLWIYRWRPRGIWGNQFQHQNFPHGSKSL